METVTVSILTSMRSNAALPQVTNLRSVRCARFRGGRLNMHQRPRPPRGHGDLPRTVGPARSVTGREQRSAPGRYEVRQNAEYALRVDGRFAAVEPPQNDRFWRYLSCAVVYGRIGSRR